MSLSMRATTRCGGRRCGRGLTPWSYLGLLGEKATPEEKQEILTAVGTQAGFHSALVRRADLPRRT